MTIVFDKLSRRTLSVHSSVIPEMMGEPALVAASITGDGSPWRRAKPYQGHQ